MPVPSNHQAHSAATAALADARGRAHDEVLIVGGGIGGLAAALALARHDIPSHVLERRPAFSEDGAGIQIGPNGTRILQQLGVADALMPFVGTPEALSVRDGASGTELARLPLGAWMQERFGAPYWVAHRKDLHNALAQTVSEQPLIRLTMGFSASLLASDDEHAAVATDECQVHTGRALIAADGIFSTMRDLLFGGRSPRFAGKTAARCVIPMDTLPAEFKAQQTTIWLFANTHVVHYPVSGGAELAVIVVVDNALASTAWDEPVPAEWVQRNMPPCPMSLRSLLLVGQTWRSWSLHTLRTPPRWTSGRTALLGDAAHPVLPFLAQGAVMALEDASVLAQSLYDHADVALALRSYEVQRRKRVMKVARASRRNGRIYHMSGVQAAARNLVLSKSPPERLMAKYDWLYGWRSE